MHTYAKPRRGYCASCDGFITDRPVYRRDEAYCCIGCAGGCPCICTYEADLAEDGVDHLGLPFAVGEAAAEPASVGPVAAAVAEPALRRRDDRVAAANIESLAAGPR